jgi:hypothetical protein
MHAALTPGGHGVLVNDGPASSGAENLQHVLAELRCGVPLRWFPLQEPHDWLAEASKLLHILWRYAALLPWQRMLW